MTDSEFQIALVELHTKIHALDVSEYEFASPSRCVLELVPKVESLAIAGADLFGLISDRYQQPSEIMGLESDAEHHESRFYTEIDGLLTRDQSFLLRIQNIAFIALYDFQGQQVGLAAITNGDDPRRVISHCQGCLNRMGKAITACENALAGYAGLQAILTHVTTLSLSLQIRYTYTVFCRLILSRPAPLDEQIRDRIRDSVLSITKLESNSIFAKLRIDDRTQLQVIRTRLLRWLAVSNADHCAGLRLLEDLRALAGILGQVRNRQELIEHDGARLQSLLKALPSEGAGQEPHLPESLFEDLRSLFGLDEELDALIVRAPLVNVKQWQPTLLRVANQCLGSRFSNLPGRRNG